MKICYEGKFSKNMMNGYGELFFESGVLRFKGNFKDGDFHGVGIKFKESGDIERQGDWNMGVIPLEERLNCSVF